MQTRSGMGGVLWSAVGAAVLVVCMLVVFRLRGSDDSASQLARKTRRLDLVAQMELDLASASEAEKSAVLASTDQESRTLADEARAASARLEQTRRELAGLLATGGTPSERYLADQFTAAFADLRRIDDELLALAVKNTNVKAYALAFGPAAAAVKEMNAALSRLLTAHAASPDAKAMMLLAFGAQTSALRIETLLPPHIAEEDDRKMDELEAAMAAEDVQVRKSLDGLAAMPGVARDPELAAATTRYQEFSGIKAQILALSRENTNVRSLSMSLNEKRKAMLACQTALGALREAVQAEPLAGALYGAPARPR